MHPRLLHHYLLKWTLIIRQKQNCTQQLTLICSTELNTFIWGLLCWNESSTVGLDKLWPSWPISATPRLSLPLSLEGPSPAYTKKKKAWVDAAKYTWDYWHSQAEDEWSNQSTSPIVEKEKSQKFKKVHSSYRIQPMLRYIHYFFLNSVHKLTRL